MNKFRIRKEVLDNGEHLYTIQERVLWLFWKRCKRFIGIGYEVYTYNSYTQALAKLKHLALRSTPVVVETEYLYLED